LKSDAPVRFAEFLIRDNYRYLYGVSAGDLNGKGHIDLVTSDILEDSDGNRNSSLYWFENDGQGTFQQHLIWESESGWFERNAIGDLTGNGWSDVVVVNNWDGHVIWFSSEGDPTSSPWKRRIITTNAPRAYDVTLVDLDGDDRLDVAVSGYSGKHITWYKNPGEAGWDQEWPRHVIDDQLAEPRSVRAGDFNGNGKPDLFFTDPGFRDSAEMTDPCDHRSCVGWYENPDDPTSQPWTKHIIDERSRGPTHGHPVDMDGDGKLDVLVAFGQLDDRAHVELHEIAWYENMGGGQQWKKHLIGKLPYAIDAFAVDLTGNGHLDVVAAAWSKGDRVVWFENPGSPQGPWTMHVLKENWPAVNQVIAADLTGNGRFDIIAVTDDGSRLALGANELRWWRNDGECE